MHSTQHRARVMCSVPPIPTLRTPQKLTLECSDRKTVGYLLQVKWIEGVQCCGTCGTHQSVDPSLARAVFGAASLPQKETQRNDRLGNLMICPPPPFAVGRRGGCTSAG